MLGDFLDPLLYRAGWLADAALPAGIASAVALAAHFAMFTLFARLARLSQDTADDEIVAALREPARWPPRSIVAPSCPPTKSLRAAAGRAWRSCRAAPASSSLSSPSR